MRVLIIGASGLVGNSLLNCFSKTNHTVLGTYNNYPLKNLVKLDITNLLEVEKVIAEFKPDVIINPAAFADVDGCEKNPQLCRLINFDGVKNVVDSTKNSAKQNVPLFVFFSTDYIFDGKNGPYSEEDQPNPINVYGQAKLDMENYIKSNLDRFLIIRTANVYGWENQMKNFVIKLINNLKQGKEVVAFTDQFGSPTYVQNLSHAVNYLVEKQFKGIYNVAGGQVINRFDFAKIICDVFKLNNDLIIPITTEKLNQAAKRPVMGGLKVDKVSRILPFAMLNCKEGLDKMREERV